MAPGTFRPLEALLEASPAPQAVAIDQDRVHTRLDLARTAGAVARLARPGERWLLAPEDAFAFAAGLLGLARAGAHIVLPPNLLEGTLAERGAACDGVLRVLPEAGDPLPGPITDVELSFWTSGSTGAPKEVRRHLSHLTDEVAVLEARFGAAFPTESPLVLGTVPHYHIYGCLFRVLWPLTAGRPFAVAPCGDPDRFAAALQDNAGAILVSSPAHLGRLPDLLDLDRLSSHPRLAFSSGGPLSEAQALRWRHWIPKGIVEVFGSTESGGVASRIQDGTPEGAAWWPFPDLDLEAASDGALHLAGARLPGGSLRMEDAVAFLPDGRFHLRGRLDRIVKLAEKRVSLPEVEAALEAHPWVARAALVVLEAPRPQLGAVLVLTPEAPAQPPLALHAALRAHLAPRFEAAALPRRWRLVPELPLGPGGKVEAARLQALFTPRDDA